MDLKCAKLDFITLSSHCGAGEAARDGGWQAHSSFHQDGGLRRGPGSLSFCSAGKFHTAECYRQVFTGQSQGKEMEFQHHAPNSAKLILWWRKGLEIPQNLPMLKGFQVPICQINCPQNELTLKFHRMTQDPGLYKPNGHLESCSQTPMAPRGERPSSSCALG